MVRAEDISGAAHITADIILGTAQLGLNYGINNLSGKPDNKSIFEILEHAYSSGIRTLDTAEAYGDALDHIRSFHKQTGSYFKINTKFTGISASAVEAELKNNIDKLGIQQVDTYLYHTFSKYRENPQLADGLKKMKADKLIKRVGLSVYSNAELQVAIDDPEIDVIQLPFNLLDNSFQRKELLQTAKTKGKHIQVRSVFLQGLFFKQLDSLPSKLLSLKPYLKELKDMATRYAVSMESLCLQYSNTQPYIDEIIIGVDNKQQLTNNLASLRTVLSPEICERIDKIQVKETELLYPYNWI